MREILLVEDSADDAALVRRALKFLSVANPVRHIFTGEEAFYYLEAAAQSAGALSVPSILLLDLGLPRMGGLQILEHIANHPAFTNTLRVVLTNRSDLETIKHAYSHGAHSYLIKPVQPAELTDVIERFPVYWSFNIEVFSEQTRRGPVVPAK